MSLPNTNCLGAFWDVLWESPISVEEVFAAIQPSDVRSLLSNSFSNLRSLVQRCVGALLLAATTPNKLDQETLVKVRNSVRILTRLIPFLFENAEDENVRDMFWTTEGEGDGKPLAMVLLHSIAELLFKWASLCVRAGF